MSPGVRPQFALEQLPSAVQTGEHRAKRGIQHRGDLLRREPLHVSEDERRTVEIGHPHQHLVHVLATERAEEVEMQRVRVREGVLVGDRSVQGEALDVIDRDLLDAPVLLAEPVSERVHQDGLQPATPRPRRAQRPERPVGSHQAFLHQIFGSVADEPTCKGIEAGKLGTSQRLEVLLLLDRAPHGHPVPLVARAPSLCGALTSYRRPGGRSYCIRPERQWRRALRVLF